MWYRIQRRSRIRALVGRARCDGDGHRSDGDGRCREEGARGPRYLGGGASRCERQRPRHALREERCDRDGEQGRLPRRGERQEGDRDDDHRLARVDARPGQHARDQEGKRRGVGHAERSAYIDDVPLLDVARR